MDEGEAHTIMEGRKLAKQLALTWALLFTLNALCTCVIAALSGAKWVQLDMQNKVLIILAIFVNWSGTMMAYLSKAAYRVMHGRGIPVNGGFDTETINKEAPKP